ncbi:alpha/beta hydrolase [Noviherbaspirillum sp. CPCC 100848]|uniref:Alpha/beta hydrolase n=1 Tax=Noviherbaspirillum album TaxID=3080276 RepID=A0ABU6JCM3_9BURK|nr:alpha/beta hydrolase [Noviherbaspirillum sp. CPCC 100848]
MLFIDDHFPSSVNRAIREVQVNPFQRNNVSQHGDGNIAMVFAHGFGCDKNMWRFVWPAFESQFRIVLFDHVGAGRSDTSEFESRKYASLERYADDVLEICAGIDAENIIFVGHSVSATIGALASIKAPDLLSRLVMVAPSPCFINDRDYVGGFDRDTMDRLLDFLDENFEAWASAIAPTVMGNLDRPELGAELTQSFCRMEPEIAKHFARLTFNSDHRSDFAKVEIPTLVMQCSQDAIAPDAVGLYVQQCIKGSHFVQLKATGHCPNMSAPDETIHAIRKFLNEETYRLRLQA